MKGYPNENTGLRLNSKFFRLKIGRVLSQKEMNHIPTYSKPSDFQGDLAVGLMEEIMVGKHVWEGGGDSITSSTPSCEHQRKGMWQVLFLSVICQEKSYNCGSKWCSCNMVLLTKKDWEGFSLSDLDHLYHFPASQPANFLVFP